MNRVLIGLSFLFLLLVPASANATQPGGNGDLIVFSSASSMVRIDRNGTVMFPPESMYGPSRVHFAYGVNYAASASHDGEWVTLPVGPDTNAVSIMRTSGADRSQYSFYRSGYISGPQPNRSYPLSFLPDGTLLHALSSGLVVADRGGTVLREDPGYNTALGVYGTSFAGSAIAPDGTVYFAKTGAEGRLYRYEWGGTPQLIAQGLPGNSDLTVVDVAPDESHVLVRSPYAGVAEINLNDGTLRQLLPDVPGRSINHIKYSPDGTTVYVASATGVNTGSLHTLDRSTLAMTQIASGAEIYSVLVQTPLTAKPEVVLTGGALFGDLIEIDQERRNPHPFGFDSISDITGGADGIVFNNLGYSEPYRAGFVARGGPTPGRVPSIGANQIQSMQYLVEATSPGYFTARAKISGKRAGTGVAFESVSNLLTVHVTPRSPAEWERFMLMTGGYADLAERQQESVAAETARALKLVNQQINKLPGLSKAEKAERTKPTAWEKSMARRMGMADDALAWLPNDPKEATRMFAAFQKGRMSARYTAFGAEAKTQVGKVKYAADFWYNQAFGPATAKVPVMPILMEGPANKLIQLESWADRAGEISAQPDADEQFAMLVDEYGKRMWNASKAKVRGNLYQIQNDRTKLASQLATDNLKGAELWGSMIGKNEAKGAIDFAKNAVGPDVGKVLGVAKLGATKLRQRGVPDIDFGAPGLDIDDLDDALPGRKPTVAETGMSKRDEQTAKRVLSDVEADVYQATGERIEMQMTFRERNVHSTALGSSAMGKIGLFSTKAGTDVDVMLGMDRKALGKAVFYKPTLPSYFNTLDDDLKHALIVRRQDMLAEWRKYTSPGSAARKAATKNGTTYQNKGPNGVVTSTIKVKTDEVFYSNGTIVLKYRELTVDGVKVVTAKKPKWVASDYDGNSVRLKGGGTLPASISSMAQLKLNRRLIQAARDDNFAYGMHGFSFNAIDLTSDPKAKFRQRDVVRFLLENMRGADRERMLKDYLKKYGPNDYMDLLAKSETGKYLISVTSSHVDTTTGL